MYNSRSPMSRMHTHQLLAPVWVFFNKHIWPLARMCERPFSAKFLLGRHGTACQNGREGALHPAKTRCAINCWSLIGLQGGVEHAVNVVADMSHTGGLI